MIDTIILNIPTRDVKILDPKVFAVQPWYLQARTGAYEKFIKNPTPAELRSGLYFPRLTAYNRTDLSTNGIKIEFSAPKLIYRNNLDELEDSQFEEVVKTLQDRLKRMGVIASIENLINAPVATVHYSKNIELTGGYRSQYVIGELGRINLNKRFDLTKARYINDGESLTAFSLTNSFVVYDKIADLNKDKKRVIDKDQSPFQQNLFKQLNNSKEIIRFEARLCKKPKINALFKQLNFADSPTFKDVFSSVKSKAVLLDYWEKMIENSNLLLFAYSITAKDLLKQICIVRPNIKSKVSIYLAGLICLAREGNGLRELRAILEKGDKARSWYRTTKDLKDIAKDLESLKPQDWFNQIKNGLNNYKTLHL